MKEKKKKKNEISKLYSFRIGGIHHDDGVDR